MLVELSGVQTALLVEGRTLVVVQVHGDVDRVAEEAAPQLGVPTLQHLGLSLQHGGEEISVAVLVLAPVLKVLGRPGARGAGCVLERGGKRAKRDAQERKRVGERESVSSFFF